MSQLKRIVRPKEGYARLGCGHTKFQDYVLRDEKEPYVPGTKIKRLRPIPLGLRNIGFLSTELDGLIDALAAERDKSPKPKPGTFRKREAA